MQMIRIVQYISLLLVLTGVPCISQTDLEIAIFKPVSPAGQFVIEQPRNITFRLEFQTKETETVELSYTFKLYFNGSEGESLPQLFQRPSSDPLQFTSPDMSGQIKAAEVVKNITFTLPAEKCASFTELCVRVATMSELTEVTKCTSENLQLICDKPKITLGLDDYLQIDKNGTLQVGLTLKYIEDYYVSFQGPNTSEIFRLNVFYNDSRNDTLKSLGDGYISLRGGNYFYQILERDGVLTFKISEPFHRSNYNYCKVKAEFICVDVKAGSNATFHAIYEDHNLRCTSASGLCYTPIPERGFFLPMILGIAAIIIFAILATIVLYRFRKRIRRTRFWSSPEEAYNTIRRRLNVRSWYDPKPYQVDVRPRANPPDIDLDEVKPDKDGKDEYQHLERPFEQQTPVFLMKEDGRILFDKEISNGGTGTDNLGYRPAEGYDSTIPENHSYEDNLPSISGSTSSQKIQVSIENEKNSVKDSQSSRQESSLSTDQDTSGGSYIQALKQPNDAPRKPSIFPVKPDVDLGGRSSGQSEPPTPDAVIFSLGFPPPTPPPPPPHQSDSSGENEEDRDVLKSLRAPPPPPSKKRAKSERHPATRYEEVPTPPQRGTSLPEEVKMLDELTGSIEDLFPMETSSEQEQSRSGEKNPPPLRPKPKAELPKPKPKPKPGSTRQSISKESFGSDQNEVPLKTKQRKRAPSRGLINITGGGSTKVPSDFRRPSLFRTNSSENLAPSSKNQKVLPDVLQWALDVSYKPPVANWSSGVWLGTMKRSQAEFATAVIENFLAIVEEIENPQESDVVEEPASNTSIEAPVSERPRRIAAKRPLSVRRNSTPLLLGTENRMSTMSETSYAGSYTSDVYVNKWNKAWEFDRNNLLVDRQKPLGEGQFGKVYHGIASNIAGRPGDTTVAIKELKDGALTEDKDEFLKELAIHTLMEPHENVIELLGCCIRDEPLCIIMEFMKNGSLLRYLRKQQKNEPHAQYLMVRFGYQIAQGMEHVANMGIVHRDLAARNILVSDQLVCKVSDFGFARDVFGVETYNKAPEKAPIRWYAPEAILDNVFTTKTDVWSFGILLFEIITMGYVLPYHRDPSTASVRLTIATGGVPPKPIYSNEELYNVMKMCWRKEPDDRPEFEEMAAVLANLQTKYEPASPYGESDV